MFSLRIFEIGVHHGKSALLLAHFVDPLQEKLLVNDTLHKRYVAQIVSTVVLNSEIEILFAYTILYYDHYVMTQKVEL